MSIFLYVKTKSSRSDRGQLKGAGLRSGGTGVTVFRPPNPRGPAVKGPIGKEQPLKEETGVGQAR